MLTERMMEIIEETGKLRMQDIENVAELQAELEAAGYTSYVDASTDYLIVEGGKGAFKEMVRDFIVDHAPEYDDLEIDECEFDADSQEWTAYCHDEKTTYSISDDGTGNLAINYVGTR